MADVTLSYKGSDILELSDSGSATLKTGGKYCEADIGVEYVKPSGGGSLPSGITAIETGSFTLAEDVSEYTITHSLGAKANLIVLVARNFDVRWATYNRNAVKQYVLLSTKHNNANAACGQYKYVLSSSGNLVAGDASFLFANHTTTSSKITVGTNVLSAKISDGTNEYVTDWFWIVAVI